MKFTTLVMLVLAGLAVVPDQAQAQPSFLKDNVAKMVRKVGLHGNVSFREPTDPDVTKGTTFGASVGLSPGRTNGWRYPFGFTTFSEYLHGPNGQQFATFRARAIMVGIGYGWHFGRLSTGASLQTGYSFNRARPDGDLLGAFDVPSGLVSVEAGNSWLLRPQAKAEYFITPKFTFRVSADYMLMRPDIVVITPTGRISDRWDASNAHANIAFGVYPFRK